MIALQHQVSNYNNLILTKIFILVVFCGYILFSGPSFVYAIESLEETTDANNSTEDFEEGFAAATLLEKDTVLRKNPANVGNKLKDLWEQVPEHELNAVDIKK